MSNKAKRVCMFMGSKAVEPAHLEAVRHLSTLLARRRHTLVWGGQASGLMLEVGNIFAEHGKGADLIGITTKQIRDMRGGKGVKTSFAARLHPACTQTLIAKSEEERNRLYRDNADSFVPLTGGYGTFMEMTHQLGQTYVDVLQHLNAPEKGPYTIKPMFLLNTNGYWNDFIRQAWTIMGEGDDAKAYSTPLIARTFWPNTPRAVTPEELVAAMDAWDESAPTLWAELYDAYHQPKRATRRKAA